MEGYRRTVDYPYPIVNRIPAADKPLIFQRIGFDGLLIGALANKFKGVSDGFFRRPFVELGKDRQAKAIV